MRHLITRPWIARSAIVALVAGPPPPAFAQSAALEPEGLRAYISQVLARNPGLLAADARLGAADQRISPAGALPDPVLTLGAMSVPVPSFDFEREPMTQFPIVIQQRFPFPGKQAAASQVMRADSVVAVWDRGRVESDLVADAVRAYYALASARTNLEVWLGRVGLADLAITVAQARYETGAAPQTDLLRARLRRAELGEQRSELDAVVAARQAQLDALRAGPGVEVVTPILTSTDALPGLRGDPVPRADTLAPVLASRSPALRAADAEVARARQAARTFDIAGRPDFTVGLTAAPRLGGREMFVSALIGLSIPLYSGSKQSPAAQAARMEVEAAARDFADLSARLEADARAVAAGVSGLHRRILQTTDEILPLAEAASASALSRYRVGEIEFGAVLGAQDDLFRLQLKLAGLLGEYAAARGELASLIGEEWYR